MKLNYSTIQRITIGADRVEEKHDGYHFHRFTIEQENVYFHRNEGFYLKTQSTSGVKLSFKTDSKYLFLNITAEPGSSRRYFSVDVFINGKKAHSIKNFNDSEMVGNYVGASLSLGEFSDKLFLGEGIKEVCVYLPWSVKLIVNSIEIDDGASISPLLPKKRILCFGDSITQGYDAIYTSNKYTTKLADFLNAEEFNKAIGGEIFFPELASLKERFIPDYIFVAYGTNDWAHCTKEEFIDNCTCFFEKLRVTYPDTPVFVFTPIWRTNYSTLSQLGSFDFVNSVITEAVDKFNNIIVLNGVDFVDHDVKYFADLYVHPNDKGFLQYIERIKDKITSVID